MKNWIVSFCVLLLAGAAFWVNRPDSWRESREHVAQARCAMIETALRAIIVDDALRSQSGYEDLERVLDRIGHIDVGTTQNQLYEPCDGIAAWSRWSPPNGLEALPDQPEVVASRTAVLVFGFADSRPWRRISTLNVVFHCGELCAQFWELEFERNNQEWVLVDITHTGSS